MVNEKYLRHRSKKGNAVIVFLLNLIVFCALTAAWAFTWEWLFKEAPEAPFYFKGVWLLYALYALTLFLINRVYGGFKIGYYKKGNVFFSTLLSTFMANVIMYIVTSLIVKALVNVLPFVVMTLIDAAVILLWANFADFIYYRLNPPDRLLMVYYRKALTESLVYKMAERAERYRICESYKIEDDLDAAKAKIMEYDAIILSDVPAMERNELIKFCYKNGIETYTTPKISDILVQNGEDITLFDTPLLLIKNGWLSMEQRFIKRLIDVVLSAIALVIASPFMLITALVIKLYDRGPVLYKQDRLTLNGKIFQVYKFRSMVVDAEKNSGARLASENDDRITPVGKIIRKIRFDELPQLINIFKGDMSIVGPRPERPEIAKEYEETIEEFSYRLKVKAGLTGYAQVVGKYNTTPYDKLKMDLMYISKYSIMQDFKIMLMTVKILFVSESTQGISPDATTADQSNGKAVEKEPMRGDDSAQKSLETGQTLVEEADIPELAEKTAPLS